MANTSNKRQSAKERQKELQKKELKRRIGILCITGVVGIVLFLSNFGIIGKIGDALSGFFFGLFGTLWYVLPLAVIVETFLLMTRPSARSRGLRIASSVGLYLGLAFVVAMAQTGSAANISFGECYRMGLNQAKGGILALWPISALISLLGKVGSWIFSMLLIAASLAGLIGFGNLTDMADDIKNWAESDERKERIEYRRQMRQADLEIDDARREQDRQRRLNDKRNQIPRMANKAQGVQFSETLIKDGANTQGQNASPDADSSLVLPKPPIAPPQQTSSSVIKSVTAPKPTDNIQEVTEASLLARKGAESGNLYGNPLDSGLFNQDSTLSAGVIHPFDGDDMFDIPRRSVIPANFSDQDPNNSIIEDAAGVTYESPEEKFIRKQRESKNRERFESDLASDVRSMMDEGQSSQDISEFSAEKPVKRAPSRTSKEKSPEKTEEIVATANTENVSGMSEVSDISASSATHPVKKSKYILPTTDLLNKIRTSNKRSDDSDLTETAEKLESTLRNFGVDAKVTDVTKGPSVTRFEIEPAVGVKVSKIVNLSDDIKLNLAASDIRMEAPIPGKSAIGIEVPNKENTPVTLREMIECSEFKSEKSKIAFGTGRDIAGQPIISDIAKMPHLLIAGATGSGKSVCINTIIMSILYRATPDEVKLLMIDPKVVELSVYNGIPHLMLPVVTDPKKASAVLMSAVAEMTKRYNLFAEKGVRDLAGYNEAIALDHIEPLPQIVIIVDELADLMMVASKEVEESICRLAQLARACGMHLIIATQRPSVNVITGLIKANMPSRIAFAVTSGIDSRTILDMYGAEKLLGKGDMLYSPQNLNKPVRAQGAFVTDEEIRRVVDFIKTNNEPAEVDEEFSRSVESTVSQSTAIDGNFGGGDAGEGLDPYLAEAGRLIIEKDRASIGFLQRNFKIGFNRAARIMDQLCLSGVVGPEEGTKPRQLMMTLEEYDAFVSAGNLK